MASRSPTLLRSLVSTAAKLLMYQMAPNGSRTPSVLIQQYSPNGGANQRWQFARSQDGQSVQILNDESGLALDPGGVTTPNVTIQQYTPNFCMNQPRLSG